MMVLALTFSPAIKTGSSALKTLFLRLVGVPKDVIERVRKSTGGLKPLMDKYFSGRTKDVAGRAVGDKAARLAADFLSSNASMLSFAFVRHPFERLVSAYENKVLYRQDPGTIYQRMADKWGPGFDSFAVGLLKQAEQRGCFRGGACNVNRHFVPMITFCGFCDVDYDHVGKYESLAEDMRRVWAAAGLADNEALLEETIGVKVNAVPADVQKRSGSQKSKEYFAQISAEQRRKFYELYKEDFQAFDYSLDGYGIDFAE